MIKLEPAYKDYIWGGVKLKTNFSKRSDLDIVAESWELSTHPDGQSIVANGEFAGKSLSEYIKANGTSVLGTSCHDDIPILIKLIDAKGSLSIQVHPDDEYALANESDFGKTEMWYILEAEPGAQLVYGFNKDLTQQEFKQHIENNTLTEVMNYVDVSAGDVFFIEAGTLHAIGAGIVIAEIQQRSNVTYRVYDYGRVGVDGKPRELHVDKSIEVTNLDKASGSKVAYEWHDINGGSIAVLVKCKYFDVSAIKVNSAVVRTVGNETFEALLGISGTMIVKSQDQTLMLNKGETVFIPANSGEYTIEGNGEVIVSSL
ncbi:MAG: mannose-6-phosphate isomerase [Epulopiscium sp. Nele67-Bin002]|nr:MAG: mannose-6-phosphate isomerase [Epulopiscium sp. Nele67-Bin002]